MRNYISSILEFFAEKIRGKESKVDFFEKPDSQTTNIEEERNKSL